MIYSPRKTLYGNFKMYEVAKSGTATRLGIDNTPPEYVLDKAEQVCKHILQPVRDEFGPFTPSSWYRCEELERAITVAGFTRFMHTAGYKEDEREAAWDDYYSRKSHPKGEAVDFEIVGVPNAVVFNWCRNALPKFDQLIAEFMKRDNPSAGWIHGSYSNLHNRNQIKTIA